LDARLRRPRRGLDRDDDLPGGDGNWRLPNQVRMLRFLERDLVRCDGEVPIEGFPGCLERGFDELFELHVREVGAGLSAHEVEVLTVAFAAVAETQCRSALENRVTKYAGFGQ